MYRANMNDGSIASHFLDIHNLQYKNIINIDVPLAIYQLDSYHNNHIQIFACEAAGVPASL